VARGGFRQSGPVLSRPPAGNANRWVAAFGNWKRKKMNTFIKVILITITTLLITGCNSTDKTYNRSLEAFEFSENCPNVCFLGIKPSETTLLEARHILKNSPDIDQSTISILHKGGLKLTENPNDTAILQMKEGDILQAIWTPTDNKEYGFYAHLRATNDRINHINARPVSTTIQDFINVIGEPDKIAVHVEVTPHADYWISYSIFYSKWKLLISVFVGSIDGPKGEAEVHYVVLNQEINEVDWKPWEGFEKMKVYMTEEQLNDYRQYNPDDSNSQP
jgi:hypothetical protein